MPPITPVTPAAIPQFFASVGVVAITAIVVNPAASVQRTAAIILYVREFTTVTPSSLTLPLREIGTRR
jgi:hypothetical protein